MVNMTTALRCRNCCLKIENEDFSCTGCGKRTTKMVTETRFKKLQTRLDNLQREMSRLFDEAETLDINVDKAHDAGRLDEALILCDESETTWEKFETLEKRERQLLASLPVERVER